MSKYPLVGVVLLLSANRFVETTPNLYYGKDCHAAAADFIPTNSICSILLFGNHENSNMTQTNQIARLLLSAK